ncbi:YegJ family protein [Ideonella sp. BN130291]|uniref:YegJ family protein n=1 Tax=Ideonella sp. BN130291 TaxID=3112940 RepID=UPI002E261CD9|nr:DUF2314 domain-containing protein [Ideonella sp. BN130291]
MSHHKAFLAVALAVIASGALAQSISDKATKDEVIDMSQEEPAMRKAFARAAETLPTFLELAAKPKEGTSSYALKVAISDGRNTEYFWVNAFSGEGEVFTGTLNNEPRLVKKYKLGERIIFRRAQVVDWTYIDTVNKRTVGNFTACALLSKEPLEQAAAFMRQYGLSCE